MTEEFETRLKDKSSLAELAYRYGFGVAYGWGELSMGGTPHQFIITFTDKTSRHRLHIVSGKTYPEAEAGARKYLNDLGTKTEGK